MSVLSYITTTVNTTSPMDGLDALVISEIISFIGPNHYYFIATINHRFQEGYLEVFPNNKKTYINASTVGYADVCYQTKCYDESKICDSAAKYGSLPALQYLRSINCNWSKYTCSNAAENGHLHILQWARKKILFPTRGIKFVRGIVRHVQTQRKMVF